MKKVFNYITNGLLIILLIFAGLLYAPKIFGIEPMAVLSGSMEPTYHVGSVIYVNTHFDQDDIEVDDPITFKISDDTLVTHRVISINENGEYVTQGDANDVADGGSVSFDNVVGMPIFTIPMLGYIATYASSTSGMILIITAILVIILLTFLPDLLGGDDDEEKGGKSDEK